MYIQEPRAKCGEKNAHSDHIEIKGLSHGRISSFNRQVPNAHKFSSETEQLPPSYSPVESVEFPLVRSFWIRSSSVGGKLAL